MQRAVAYLETLMELLARERRAGLKDVARGPAIVGQEDVEGVGGGHR